MPTPGALAASAVRAPTSGNLRRHSMRRCRRVPHWQTCRDTYRCKSAIPYHTIPYHTIPYHTIPYHTIPYHTIPYHAIPYHTIPYHTIPYHTMPYHGCATADHTIPYHTIPYHTILTPSSFKPATLTHCTMSLKEATPCSFCKRRDLTHSFRSVIPQVRVVFQPNDAQWRRRRQPDVPPLRRRVQGGTARNGR